ncbi:hypothetical protein GN956_G22406 [Arapaima gigas]
MAGSAVTATRTVQGAYQFGLPQHCAAVTLQGARQEEEQRVAGHDSATAVLNRQRPGSPQLLRCKRRLTFAGLGFDVPPQQQQQQQQPPAVARRNERERNRVRQVNMGFQTLRQHVPSGAASRKMSKVETLRSAVEYIRALQRLLDAHDAVNVALQRGAPSPAFSSCHSAEPESPHSTCSSEGASLEPLGCEDHELLDFSTWFDGSSKLKQEKVRDPSPEKKSSEVPTLPLSCTAPVDMEERHGGKREKALAG